MEYENYPPSAYDAEISQIEAALQEAAGSDDEYRNRALEAQMESAKAARENAMKIASLQASTSRYGIDAQSATAMRALKENARQFDAQHGLDIAKAYTAFASTPDLMFARNDFMSAMGRVGQGLSPSPTITQSPGPQAKTWQDFAALAQYNGSTVPGASSGGGSSPPSGGGAGASPQSAGPDLRVKAADAIMKAAPPSDSPGADAQDWTAINAIVEMYKAGNPAIQKLGAARTKIAHAGLARAGYDPNLIQEEFLNSVPGQRSPMLA